MPRYAEKHMILHSDILNLGKFYYHFSIPKTVLFPLFAEGSVLQIKNEGGTRMGKKSMRALAIILVLGVLAGCLPAGKSMAATYNLRCDTKKGSFYVTTADEAFDILERDDGGTITVCNPFPWTTDTVRHLAKNMKIIVPDGIILGIDGAGIEGEGDIMVMGTLALTISKCDVFHITGKIETSSTGRINCEKCVIGPVERISDTAATIYYGQKLPAGMVDEKLVGRVVCEAGKWVFCDQSTTFEVGRHNVEVRFEYEKTIFEPRDVRYDVTIQVDKAVPKLDAYTVPEIALGEKFGDLKPRYSFSNPYTGELITGTLAFTEPDSIAKGLGETHVKALFTPNDSAHYEEVEVILDVQVVAAAPKAETLPKTTSGQYGQTLKDIKIARGVCVDTQSGEVVDGCWSWKDETTPLMSGENSYRAVFTPNDKVHYKSIEEDLVVAVSPVRMTSVPWPVISPIKEGQHLFELTLSFTANEYGRYVWQDETQVPKADYNGAVLEFIPYANANYDWSDVPGYEEQSKKIKRTVPLEFVREPEPTEKPEGTGKPEETPAPSAEAEPSVKPEPSAKPEPSTKPEPTEKPEGIGKPEETSAPSAEAEPSVKPEPSTKPGPTEKPEGTDRPEETPAPSAGAEPTQIPSDPVVIKKMSSKISKIKTPTSGAAALNQPQIRKIKRVGQVAKVTVKKIKKAQYEIRYSMKKSMKNAKKKRFSGNTVCLRRLKSGKTYYAQTRILRKKKGRYVYGRWSKKRKL